MRRPLAACSALLVLALAAPSACLAAWQVGGNRLSPEPGFARTGHRPVAVCTDGAGGALVVWQSEFNLPDYSGTYYYVDADRVDALGNRPAGWLAGGTPIMSYANAEGVMSGVFGVNNFWLVPDGAGGAVELQHEWGFIVEPITRLSAFRVLGNGTIMAEGGSLFGRASAHDVAIAPSGGAGNTMLAYRPRTYSPPLEPLPWQPLLVQHHDVNGVPAWLPVELAPDRQYTQFAVCPDGSGGAYVAWVDLRDPADPDLYAQHVAGDGTVAAEFPAAGLEVCGIAGAPESPAIVPDGSGGAIVVWLDPRAGAPRVFASHVLGSGVLDSAVPVDGRAVAPGRVDVERLGLHADGQGGAYLIGDEILPPALRKFLLRMDPQGNVLPGWPTDGRLLGHAPSSAGSATIEPDGAGGVWATFLEPPASSEPPGLYAVHLQGDGTPAPGFTPSGYRLSDTGGAARLTRSGAAAIAVWRDERASAPGVYAQLLLPDGPVAVQVSLLSAEAAHDRVALRWLMTGGATAATVERRDEAGDWEALAELRADPGGTIAWDDRDVAPATRYGYRLRWNEGGEVRTGGETWVETRGPLALALEAPRPNPSAGPLGVALSLPDSRPATLEVLDLAGRRVASRGVGGLGPGRHTVTLDLGAAAPGVYTVRLLHGGGSRAVRFCRVR